MKHFIYPSNWPVAATLLTIATLALTIIATPSQAQPRVDFVGQTISGDVSVDHSQAAENVLDLDSVLEVPVVKARNDADVSTLRRGSDGANRQIVITEDDAALRTVEQKAMAGWSALGDGLGVNGTALALSLDSAGNLYVGGDLWEAGGNPTNGVVVWDGSTWSSLGSGIPNTLGGVFALATDDADNLYAGGRFVEAGGDPANGVAMWDGSTWTSLGLGIGPTHNDYVQDMAFDDAGNLYVVGGFQTAGGDPAISVAVWSGSTWSAVGGGLNSFASAAAFDDAGNLYVGGNFTQAGGNPANYVAMWNGSEWSALGAGFDNQVYDLAIDDSGNVYAAGTFTQADGNPASLIAMWDGSGWTPLGVGINGTNTIALEFDGAGNLYVGGDFVEAGGIPASRIAMWDGSTWSALGTGIGATMGGSHWISAMAYDGNTKLYVGGGFQLTGGIPANNVGVWGKAVIPVELTSFAAQANGNEISLAWETASETNNAGFEVQMEDEGAWTALGFVDGYGTTTEAQSYSYTVSDLASGTFRFRLKQIDYDGAFEYSPQVEIAIGVPGTHVLTQAYPNPFNPQASFSLSVSTGQQVDLALFDALGRRVATLFTGYMETGAAHTFTLEGQNLPSGAYTYRAAGETFLDTRQVTLLK